MTDDIALVPSPDVGALAGLPENQIDAAVGVAWESFGRRTVVDAWHIGGGLRRVKDGRGRHFAAYCEQIGMSRSWAYRLLKIADAPLAEVCSHGTVDGAVKALKAAPQPQERPTQQPESAADAPAEPDPPARDPDEILEAEGNAAMNEAAREHEEQRDHDAEREEEEERHAMQVEHVDPDDEQRKAAQRHREDVAAVNEARRMAAVSLRKCHDIRDAWLVVPRDSDALALQAMIDDWLARFFSVARK